MKQKILFLVLILLSGSRSFSRCNFCVSVRDTRIYYYFKQFDYFNYQLNRLETRLDRTREYLRKQIKFKTDLLDYKQAQLDQGNYVQADLAQYRLRVWCEECHCEMHKLMRKVRRVQDQISYEWDKRLQLDQKLAWIDHVLVHDSCPDAVQLREFADRLKLKFDQLEVMYKAIEKYSKSSCQP